MVGTLTFCIAVGSSRELSAESCRIAERLGRKLRSVLRASDGQCAEPSKVFPHQNLGAVRVGGMSATSLRLPAAGIVQMH